MASSGIDHHPQSFLTELLDDLERVSYYYEDFIVPSKVVLQQQCSHSIQLTAYTLELCNSATLHSMYSL
jgi:hypothetical protein